MEQLEKNWLSVRRSALLIVLMQLAITLISSFLGLVFVNFKIFLSLLLGGGTGSLASLLMVLTSFRASAKEQPIKHLNRFYLAEFYKLSLTAFCFGIIFFTLEVNFLALMFGFLITLMSYRLALYMRLAF